MFTGRIEHTATVTEVIGDVLRVKSAIPVTPGGAVCLDGIRFTAEPADAGEVRVVVTDETRRRTTLDRVAAGTTMNVELPIAAGDRIDGHLVQGHVEGVGKILRVTVEPAGQRVWIKPPDRLLAKLVAKSSVAIDGVSITVAEVLKDRFSVVLVPNTLEKTTLGGLAEGDRVNLESDLLVRMARDGQGPELLRAVSQLPWAGQLSGEVGVQKVVAQIAAGGGVVVWDPTAESEGDVVFAGERFRPEAMTFLLTLACGHTTIPSAADVLKRLEIPPMPGEGDRQGTAMHVSIDLASATGTGVSAAERAATIRRLAAADAVPTDFLRPGHVFPLAARPGLLGERLGHTEATVALCLAAGLAPVGVCCEVMRPDGVMAGPADLEQFTLRWELPMIDIHDLVRWL
ncbi:3,4-dihydroxy 2-butanone 4-phosphate synthase/3,4-dihydroxy 2-butanone 4-phosphate synthase/GTP cyclohydrolase II [Kribbella steppae]|uniref:3,4-dihydroxy-2-butanone-4-phosphate synthase n=1 Tax=Kribbella steppae TaxID=2512223 RepID=A0A4V2RYC6_9ACTN|nr:3,4-dihydroxy-2-butanone-4-phosphate synthase [Kribbella steppae]TCO19176.1 3,4-dihydroxy 2-butanone 4-phosphate synthase/3,4-dihydroxy 2-butanone 4-phosphate synthase/GTP cyclohydrolase II [Kribbella steppae]